MPNHFAVLHIAPSVGRASFGIGSVVLGLASAQHALGYAPSLWCQGEEHETRDLADRCQLSQQTIRCFPAVGPRRLGFSPAMEAMAATDCSHKVLHQHGIWTGISRVTNRWRRGRDRPTVIAPHGSLDAWALGRSVWKKRLALLTYENENLRQASCLHALSAREAESIRRFGLCNPIAVMPNGITEAWIESRGDPGAFRRRFGVEQGVRVALYVGRITPKKGLPMLIRALSTIMSHLKDWKLLIVGSDEFGHEQELRALVTKLSMSTHVQFTGPLFDQDKRDAYAASDLLVLPSQSEGAPMVVLEALGAGLPVLATKASPWEELLLHDCGWWTQISGDSIASALLDAMQRPAVSLQQMGQRGQALVSGKYTWPQVARQTVLLYRWLQGDGPQPDFVLKD